MSVIGLGFDHRLLDLRRSGAVTYEGWQAAGLTRVDPLAAILSASQFERSFDEAANGASVIRFDLTDVDITRAVHDGPNGFVSRNYTKCNCTGLSIIPFGCRRRSSAARPTGILPERAIRAVVEITMSATMRSAAIHQPTAEVFDRWHGGRVKIWDYSPTLGTLTIRVESCRRPGNLHVICGGCQSIHGPFHWDGSALEVVPSDDAGWALRDTVAGFELRCRVVGVEEDVEPVYGPAVLATSA